MTMTFALHDELAVEDIATGDENYFVPRGETRIRPELHLIESKITIPDVANHIKRRRINRLLQSSAAHFAASLISGRAQTGKTAAAAAFAAEYARPAWYTIDSSDGEWPVFSSYLAASLAKTAGLIYETGHAAHTNAPSKSQIADFLAGYIADAAAASGDKQTLLVLDEVHHVFDAPWFPGFFSVLLGLVGPNVHVLMLCRSKPPLPLWRLRSKQVLNLIDERALTVDEVEERSFRKHLRCSNALWTKANKTYFGRIGKIVEFVDSYTVQPRSL